MAASDLAGSSVLEALEPGPRPGVRCKAGAWLAGLSEPEREGVTRSVRALSSHTTHSKLLAGGINPCSASVWHRHWTGICCCPQPTNTLPEEGA